MSSYKIVRIVLIVVSIIVGVVVILMAVTLAPLQRHVDRSTMEVEMKRRIDALSKPVSKGNGFVVGFAKENITPDHEASTAGYGKRMGRAFTSVHDSIFVRTLVISNGIEEVAIVSADLLIIPPEVTLALERLLPEIGFNLGNTYLGAIHSHNSVGNWTKGASTIMYGEFDQTIVNDIAEKITSSIQKAKQNMLPSTFRTASIEVDGAVQNRLIDDGPVDSKLRALEIIRSDSSKLLMLNFTAHATCLFSKDLELSRDYPGLLVDTMESRGYQFAMFMAGAVGSHTNKVKAQGWPCADDMVKVISSSFAANINTLTPVQDHTVWMQRVPLALTSPQVKMFRNWRIRPWLFTAVFGGDYPEYLTALRLGDIIMLGTPCDYSGEFYKSIDSLAAKQNMKAMITSFNGGYIGYVTPSKYYDEDHYETQLMNWYGPGNSEYMEKCLEQLIIHATEEK